MSNLFDYLSRRGDLSFKESGVNAVDGMILSQLAYLPFEDAELRYPIRMSEAADRISRLPGLEDTVLFSDDVKLTLEMTRCPRFSEIEILSFVNRVDDKTQFSAITYRLFKGLIFIAFRGTDETLVGWKENFNMGFTFPVPAQSAAVEYFESTAKKHIAKFIIAGHSKGGNLAVYAAAASKARFSGRILKAYNYDGPGFCGGMLESDAYKRVEDRIETYVPQTSLIGMLFEHEDNYLVVHSSAANNGLLQHELYTWEVLGDTFVFEADVTGAAHMADKTFRTWVESLDMAERESFVEALFLAVSETDIKTVKDFDGIKSAAGILRAIARFDDKTRSMVISVLSRLVKAAAESLT